MLMLSVQGDGQIDTSCLRHGMTDIEADGVAQGECEVESQVEGVIGDINDEGEISGPWIGLGLFETLKLMATLETLALRKELGSGSYGRECKMLNRAMVKCEILTKGLGLALVGDGQIELMLMYGMTDIEAKGVSSETLALRKELGSGFYVTGRQDVEQGYGDVNADAECPG
ncbi:Ul16-Binding Protein 3 [Manis pentadactyla]|nr:Ul16-Binding Protein 3 [Manis pentadactyla]